MSGTDEATMLDAQKKEDFDLKAHVEPMAQKKWCGRCGGGPFIWKQVGTAWKLAIVFTDTDSHYTTDQYHEQCKPRMWGTVR